MGRSASKRQVDLVEETVEDGGATAGGRDADATSPTSSTDPSRSPRRRVAAVAAGLVAALLVVGVVGQGVVAARERDRLAALASSGNVAAPLDEPPRVLWTSDERAPSGQVWITGGGLAGAVEAPDGTVRARAIDLATGATTWEVGLLTPGDRPTLEPGAVTVAGALAFCRPGTSDSGPTGTVLCVADNSVLVRERASTRRVPATVTRLVLLDARDGTVLTDLTDEAAAVPVAESYVPFGDLVLLAGRTSDGAEVRAVRRDGTVAWRTSVPAVRLEPADSTDPLLLYAVGDHAALVTPDAVHLLDATGATVHRTPRDRDTWVSGVTRDAIVLESGSTTGDSSGPLRDTSPPASTLVRADGDVPLPGTWVWLGVDDGTAPFATLTVGSGGLQAWDRKGAPLWTAEVGMPSAVVALDGLVHLVDDTVLLTLDARTGAEVWRVTDLRRGSPLITDGRHLVTAAGPARGEGGGTQLVAVDHEDGSEVWRAPARVDVENLHAVGGVLLSQSWEHDGSTARGGVTVLR